MIYLFLFLDLYKINDIYLNGYQGFSKSDS
jgi:hypothetical protein